MPAMSQSQRHINWFRGPKTCGMMSLAVSDGPVGPAARWPGSPGWAGGPAGPVPGWPGGPEHRFAWLGVGMAPKLPLCLASLSRFFMIRQWHVHMKCSQSALIIQTDYAYSLACDIPRNILSRDIRRKGNEMSCCSAKQSREEEEEEVYTAITEGKSLERLLLKSFLCDPDYCRNRSDCSIISRRVLSCKPEM